jgi:hypothetical protein
MPHERPHVDARAILAAHYLYTYGCWAPYDDHPGQWACAPACGATGPILPGETARELHNAHVAQTLAEAGIDDVVLARTETLTYAAEEVAELGPELTPDGVREWLLGRV